MVIVFVVPTLESGGAERVMRLVANRLANGNLDWRVFLVSLLDAPEPSPLGFLQPGAKLEVVRLGCKRVSLAAPALWWLLVRIRARVVVSTLPHVIRMVSVVKMMMFMSIHHIARLANTYTLQDRYAGNHHRGVAINLARLTNSAIDHFIAVSSGVAQDFRVLYHIPENNISVINNPIEPESFVYTNQLPAPRDYRRVLLVGRLVEQKNFELAIRAFLLLKRRLDVPLRLTLVGEGTQKQMLSELANSLGVADEIEFEGYRRNVGDYYRASNVLLLTSLYEGFPNVLIEALHHGLPVVSVNCKSGPSDIIVDERLGRLTNYDPIEIAGALEYCLNDISGSKAAEFREQHIKQKYSIEYVSEHYRKYIEMGLFSRQEINEN